MDLKEIRHRLDVLSLQTLAILMERTNLVREVALQKKNENRAIHNPVREAEVLSKAEHLSDSLGLDRDYVQEIFCLMIAHAKEAEAEIVGCPTYLNENGIAEGELRQGLIALTKETAENYDSSYVENSGQADALSTYLRYERQNLSRVIDNIDEKGMAIDLGCATGRVSRYLQSKSFKIVKAFDLSEDMINAAVGIDPRSSSIVFQACDLQDCIPCDSGSVDCAVANFGAASEVSTGLLAELKRVLKPRGRAFLSYYNQEALSTLWYYPYPSTLKAHLNPCNDTVEVYFHDKVFVISARATTRAFLSSDCERAGLRVVWSESYPTLQSILPRFFWKTDKLHYRSRHQRLLSKAEGIDTVLARVGEDWGTYLMACVQNEDV